MISLSDKMPLKFIRIRNAPSQDASISILYVQETGIMTADHAKATKINHFNSYLFIYVLNGSGTIEFENGDIRKISAGQCAVMDCRYPHSYKRDENEPWELLWVHFNGVSAQYYFSKFEDKKCNVFVPQNPDNIMLILSQIVYCNSHKTEHTELLNSKFLTDLLTTVIANYRIYDEDESDKDLCKIEAIKEYIDNNFTRKLNLDHIADTFHINKFNLIREFKKNYNITIIQYIINKKMEQAKDLLSHTNKSIEEISELCGFNDPSYFSKQFKKIENITCLNYRKNNRQ